MDCIVYGVSKSRTWLSDFHKEYIEFYTLYFYKKKNESKLKLQQQQQKNHLVSKGSNLAIHLND